MPEMKRVELKFFNQDSDDDDNEASTTSSTDAQAAGRAMYSAFMGGWLLMLVIGSPDWNYWRSLGATAAAIVITRGLFAFRDVRD